jgi:DNA-directed RNA polymerase subunit K/omega
MKQAQPKVQHERMTGYKFVQVKVIADRVRQLEMGAPSLVESKGGSFMELAIEELRQGKIQFFHKGKPFNPLLNIGEKEKTEE